MKIQKLSEYGENNSEDLKILLYGTSGIGKTTFANTFPQQKFLISTDGRFKHLSNKEETAVARLNYTRVQDGITKYGWDDFKTIVKKLQEDNGKNFKTIIIDLITDIYEMCRKKMLHSLGIIHESDLGYGKAYSLINDEFYPVIKSLIGIPANVIMIAHEKETENGITPNLPGSVITKLQGYVQLNGRMVPLQEPGKEMVRKLHFIPSLRETASNIVGISRAIEPNHDELVKEIKKTV